MQLKFSPGFRLSFTDTLFLCFMFGLFWYLRTENAAASWLVLTPTLQFFLFCNVFRIRRSSELMWAVVYIIISALSHSFAVTGIYTFAAGIAAGMVFIGNELRHPSYHGIFWQKLNPGLPEWFAANEKPAGEGGH